jgi:arsenate reductase
MNRHQVLFLCTGNSCRSQMAEAIVNARLGEAWTAHSAGMAPAATVHPLALQALREIGIQHEGRTKSAEEFRHAPLDLVVTMCDDAAEACPVWWGRGQLAHLGFRDPARVEGTPDEALAAFRAVRDEIAEQVPALLCRWESEHR